MTRRGRVAAIVFVAGLCAVPSSLQAANETPSAGSAFSFEPYGFEFGGAANSFRALCQDQNIPLTAEVETTGDTANDAGLPELNSLLGGGHGFVLVVTHGSADGLAAEAYLNLSDAEAAYQAYTGPNGGYSTQELRLRAAPGEAACHVSVTDSYIAGNYQSSDAIAYIAACESSQYASAWSGSRCALSYSGCPSPLSVGTDLNTFWSRLNGSEGIASRNVGAAVAGLGVTASGDVSTTVTPAVSVSSLDDEAHIPRSGKVVFFTFDTDTDESAAALVVAGPFSISNITWSSPSELSAVVRPRPNEYGYGSVYVSADEVASANSSDLHLAGDEDYVVTIWSDDNPAGDVGNISYADGRLHWRVVSEFRTAFYRVEAWSGQDWVLVAVALPGVGNRSVSVPPFGKYRLMEVETTGRKIFHGVAVNESPPPMPTVFSLTLSEQRELLRLRTAELVAEGPDVTSPLQGEKLAIFAPSAFAPEIAELVSYLDGVHGVITASYELEAYGPAESSLSGIQAEIRAAFKNGYQYVLLVGDASDWEYFDGPLTSQYWPPDWESIRQGYLNSGYPAGGNPSFNLLPMVVEADPATRDENMAWHQPYFVRSDMLTFGDVDSDGLPDLTVGRLPFKTASDLSSYIYKLESYFSSGFLSSDPYPTAMFVGDVDHDQAGEGALALQIAEELQDELPAGSVVAQLFESESDGWDRIFAASDIWNEGPELVAFVGTLSNRSRPANFFKLPDFTLDLINPGSWTPIVLGTSCGTGDFARTEDPTYGAPVMERMLAAWSKGAIGWTGPTAGTWQDGNRTVARAFLAEVSANPARPVAESLRLVLREVLSSPTGTESARKTARSYGYYGFPLAPLYHQNFVVGTDPAKDAPRMFFARPEPNPTSGGTRFRFALAQGGPVDLQIYDMSGRRVATVLQAALPAGTHEISWNGKSRRGDAIPTGVYYARLRTPTGVLDRRLLILR